MKGYDFEAKRARTHFGSLTPETQKFLEEKALRYRFSHSQFKELCDMAVDLQMWGEETIREIWEDRRERRELLSRIRERYREIRERPKSYRNFQIERERGERIRFREEEKKVGFGLCPVASPKTRCCNLWTLDLVESCGFDCSYCSIQSFYNQETVTFNRGVKEKLLSLPIDRREIYHIGTGQSSDSLMWGNREGILEALISFARTYPNVILELKTKSDNVGYLLDHDYPPNIITTWSLNPQTIIEKEERFTASLERRLDAAQKIHDKGRLIGFHFHPMIHYQGWQEEYGALFQELLERFDPRLVAMVSFGTLTFIKPVIKRLRQRAIRSKVLQMPFVESNGKLSYPLQIKEELFSLGYNSLKPWHGKLFFYLCMEDHSLWKRVFGYDYPTNESFELAMKYSYLAKIKGLL
ncbi:MAG: hypothetical protein GXO19_03790 [Epsilonproteobacteria bacterium]|nr:hypothetical protein [Campylobacterota bacterium]NPA56842.1 hypothetical protein [Campylobacterota bacterium]